MQRLNKKKSVQNFRSRPLLFERIFQKISDWLATTPKKNPSKTSKLKATILRKNPQKNLNSAVDFAEFSKSHHPDPFKTAGGLDIIRDKVTWAACSSLQTVLPPHGGNTVLQSFLPHHSLNVLPPCGGNAVLHFYLPHYRVTVLPTCRGNTMTLWWSM